MTALYLISQGENGPVKIGITQNVKSRLRVLQTGNPAKLNLIGQIEFTDHASAAYVEAEQHEYFSKKVKRLTGEWFLIDEDRAEELFFMNAAWFDYHFNDLGWHPQKESTWTKTEGDLYG